MCVARFKMAHFKIYEGGQKPEFLSVCVVVHFTCFLGGPSNGIKRVDSLPVLQISGGTSCLLFARTTGYTRLRDNRVT